MGVRLKRRKEGKAIYKRIDEIRKDLKMTQENFAKEIGMIRRQYIARFNGENPNWKLAEVIKASKFNDGKIIVDVEGKTYFFDITEVKL